MDKKRRVYMYNYLGNIYIYIYHYRKSLYDITVTIFDIHSQKVSLG